ncbi:hypothetical protein [Micavibrio aeruginosavorus]|uniref:hypothetical protein n=1 Tax=Micavibrio aeruginosavorus TaxID=349221 RepID=UPI003F4AD105
MAHDMDIKELDGHYQVSVKGHGKGVYSQKTVGAHHTIENGSITGTDEYGVLHSGSLTAIDDDHVAFTIRIDPLENKEIITTLENGLLSDGAQTIKGTYTISRKDGQILLTAMEEHGGVTGVITCKRT